MNYFDQSKLLDPNQNWKLNPPRVIGHSTEIIIFDLRAFSFPGKNYINYVNLVF